MLTLTCPVCRAELATRKEGADFLLCSACKNRYPLLGRVPVLLQNPSSYIDRWAAGLDAFILETDVAVSRLLVQGLEEGLTPRARKRVKQLAQELPHYRDRIAGLLLEVGICPRPSTISHSSGGTSAGNRGPELLSYYSLIHRDFAWGSDADEVTPAVRAVLGVLPPKFRLGNTLVLGAGTARLAWELGRELEEEGDILALDINPLPFLVTQRLMGGAPVNLYELPGHPRRSTLASVERVLRAPGSPPPGLRLLLADALDPPVLPASIDTIITPWFLDQVPKNLATFLPKIHSLLREGGSWIHVGPFVYDPAHTEVAHRYCADEFIELVKGAGFTVVRATYEPVAHLVSPLSTQGRREFVLNMLALKTSSRKIRDGSDFIWWDSRESADAKIPEPPGSLEFSTPHPTLTRVLVLINGKRSARELATALIQEGKLADDGTAVAAVQGCLRAIEKTLRIDQLGR